ncbi:hypothetical protein [Mesoplasma corruscae]|uniref:DUF3899 domain-containing protein n=1 Tax=Mesoplasma corruscae TaxID=216874 RepID=A0A2S5RHZ2_9MOLU|nr:hypothetical protein [Mesoplasma corruscae]PPE06842.1 hypothetical protein MCORR_v1c04730 [Mesoplasma corruscae]
MNSKSKNISKLSKKNKYFKEADNNFNRTSTEYKYKYNKKLRYYHYLIVVAFVFVYTIVTFLLTYFLNNTQENLWEYLITSAAFLFLLFAIINGWLRNRKTAKFFNDSRKRYHSTFTEEEGKSKKISKVLFLISFLFFVEIIIIILSTL